MSLFLRKLARSFSLIEVIVSLGLMTVVLLSMLAAEASGSQLRMVTRQTEFINSRVQSYFESMRDASDVTAVRALAGTGIMPLGPQYGDESDAGPDAFGNGVANGIVVTAVNQRILLESECSMIFGGNYDLDRDGTPNSNSSDPVNYQTVVPMQVSVTWTNSLTGNNVPRTLVFNTIVYPSGALQ